MKIHKQSLPLDRDTFKIEHCAGVLHIAVQLGVPQAWFMYKESASPMMITAHMTGNNMDEYLANHVGTVLMNNGGFVLHYFAKRIP